MPEFLNVKEQWFLYDTINISSWIDELTHPITGWYNSFAALGAADNVTFFDSRNKSVGLAYNNQDSRDQIPYAFVVNSLSVAFFAPATASQIGDIGDGDSRNRIDTASAWWTNELPQHASAEFIVNQDTRLKANCAMLPSGYGPVGGAMGQGDTSVIGGYCNTVDTSGMGVAHLKYRWTFPTGIGVPRRATLKVVVRFSEWARAALGLLWGPGNIQLRHYIDDSTSDVVQRATNFQIQCLLQGKRQVQQRGEYHA